MPAPTKYLDSRKVLLQDSILSVLASLLSILLLRWLAGEVPGFVTVVLRWMGCALAASLAGFFTTGCYHYVRRYATIRSLGHVVLAIVVKELILAAVLLLRLVPVGSAMTAISLLLADFLLACVFLLYIRVAARLFSTEGDDKVNAVVGKKNVLDFAKQGDGRARDPRPHRLLVREFPRSGFAAVAAGRHRRNPFPERAGRRRNGE